MIYSKAAYVLRTLFMWMRDPSSETPDQEFYSMLQDFYSQFRARYADTDDFKNIAERHLVPWMDAKGDGSLDWFFDQWIHGTDFPNLYHDLKVELVDGKNFRVHGTLNQANVSDEFIAAVPLYLTFKNESPVFLGRIGMKGNMAQEVDFVVPSANTPTGAEICSNFDMPFYSEKPPDTFEDSKGSTRFGPGSRHKPVKQK